MLPTLLAGPMAGVALDRCDRTRIMIASDLVRAATALAFVLALTHRRSWLLYPLSALLTFASPFFSSGRLAILPRITTPKELHTANALTQTTAWLTLSIGTMLGGVSTMKFGYGCAFVANTLSFVFSAWAVNGIRSSEGHFRALAESQVRQVGTPGWREFLASVGYIRANSVILAVGLAQIGWASGGGAAQVLFTLYGEIVFKVGPAGIGLIWGAAGVGLVIGGLGHRLGARLTLSDYKLAIALAFFVDGSAYIAFAVMPVISGAVVFILLSRVGMGVCNVLNRTMLLTHVQDAFRGRVFSTFETTLNSAMMASLLGAGIASNYFSIRGIGVVASILSTSTSIFWFLADVTGRMPEPGLQAAWVDEMELAEPGMSGHVP
ncbi:MAG: MFS transporter [Bryobacteraceae bacterium]